MVMQLLFDSSIRGWAFNWLQNQTNLCLPNSKFNRGFLSLQAKPMFEKDSEI